MGERHPHLQLHPSPRVFRQETLLVAYLLFYFFLHLTFLTDYPFIHSDEPWLSGLTRNMMESGSLGATEPFFDLKPRWPHAIKSLFHVLQMPFLMVFGYSVFSFRLLSLMFSVISLLLFYLFFRELIPEQRQRPSVLPLAAVILLSLNIQFIYASHFARQEIILVAGLLGCALLLRRGQPLSAGIVTGLCVGIHPNSFIIGTMGLFMAVSSLRKKPVAGLYYSLGAGGIASIFVGLSFLWDGDFLRHYFQYGNSEFDVGAPVSSKLLEFPLFLQKLWHQVSGTYYLPDIRWMMILSAVLLPVGLLLLFYVKRTNQAVPFSQGSISSLSFLYRGLAGIFVGMVIIGRYNPTSILFFLPLLLALFLLILNQAFSGKKRKVLLGWIFILLIGGSALHSFWSISPWLPSSQEEPEEGSYEYYLGEIASHVSPEDRVLANLNADYYFDNDSLRDVRNLAYLKEAGLSIGKYIQKNQIRYIILSDEMDFIYERRPLWNTIYGNPRYVPELRAFLQEKCILVHQFQDNTYGIRIVGYMRSDRNFTVQIFEVQDFI